MCWEIDIKRNHNDGMALDRPSGINRNAGEGPANINLDLRWYREFRLQPTKKEKSSSITFTVDAFNVLNRVNYPNYIGALTSAFFGHAVATLPARRMQFGTRFQF